MIVSKSLNKYDNDLVCGFYSHQPYYVAKTSKLSNVYFDLISKNNLNIQLSICSICLILLISFLFFLSLSYNYLLDSRPISESTPATIPMNLSNYVFNIVGVSKDEYCKYHLTCFL